MILAGNTSRSGGIYGNRDYYALIGLNFLLHWTGLLVSPKWSDDEIDKRVSHAIKSTESNHIDLKKRWDEFWEAHDFIINDFGEWWREKTYPHLVHKDMPHDGSEEFYAEHIRLARLYIVDYKELDTWDTARFTTAVPEDIKSRVKESQKTIRETIEQGWKWDPYA